MSNHGNMTSYPGACCARCSPLLQKPTYDTGHAGTRSHLEIEPKCPIVPRHWRCVRRESIQPFKPFPPLSLLQPRPAAKHQRQVCIHGNEKATFTFIMDTFIQNGDRKWFKHTAELMRWKVVVKGGGSHEAELPLWALSEIPECLLVPIYKMPEHWAPEPWKCAFSTGQRFSTKGSSCTHFIIFWKWSFSWLTHSADF